MLTPDSGKLQTDRIVTRSDRLEFFLIFQEDIHQFRIEMASPLFPEKGKHRLPGPGLVVNAPVGQGIEDIGHANDPAIEDAVGQIDRQIIVSKKANIDQIVAMSRLEEISTNRKDNQEMGLLCLHLLQASLVYIIIP